MALYESQERPSVACDSCILGTAKPAGFLDQPDKHRDHGEDEGDQPGDEPAETGVDDVSLHTCPSTLHSCSRSCQKVFKISTLKSLRHMQIDQGIWIPNFGCELDC